jgi:uncharacterized protein (DUF433 family)
MSNAWGGSVETIDCRHIAKTPGICGGRACIAGHRIRVADIVVWHELRGYSPDEIVDMFPGISLGDVYASLTYYCDYREEIDEDLRLGGEAAEWVRANIPSKIPDGLRGPRGG